MFTEYQKTAILPEKPGRLLDQYRGLRSDTHKWVIALIVPCSKLLCPSALRKCDKSFATKLIVADTCCPASKQLCLAS
jgi:hypothetical protein